MPNINFGEIGNQTIEEGQTADPFAQSMSGAMVPAPKIEQHLHRSLVPVSPVDAQRALDGGEFTGREAVLADIYEAIVDGRQIVDLNVVMKDARPPNSENAMPKIAFAPARFSTRVLYCTSYQDRFTLNRGKFGGWKKTFHVSISGMMPYGQNNQRIHSITRRTAIPYIPEAVRQRVGKDMKGKFVFWEPTRWIRMSESVGAMRVVDPALLEHLHGDLYAVVGTWELNALEIAALGG